MIQQLKEKGNDETTINKINNKRLQDEKDVRKTIQNYLISKNIKIADKASTGRKSRGREDKDDFTLTVPNPKTDEIKVSYYIIDKEGNKREISFVGKDMSRFSALRYLLDETIKIIQ